MPSSTTCVPYMGPGIPALFFSCWFVSATVAARLRPGCFSNPWKSGAATPPGFATVRVDLKEVPMPIGRFPVEAGQVLQFARSLGDTNSIFIDPDVAAAAGLAAVPAPPTFVQSSAHFD